MSRRRGFTLLEVMIALGIFAMGASAAFAVLVAAASAERRASHAIHASLIADGVFSEIQADYLFPGLTLQDLVDNADPSGGAVQGSSVWVIQDKQHPVYEAYRYDVALTPVQGADPDSAWSWFVEVEVRWSDRGRGRSANFQTVLLSTLTHTDNPVSSEVAGRGVRIR